MKWLSRSTIVVAAMVVAVGTFATGALAAAGQLDPSFGDGGKVRSNFSDANADILEDLAIQPDGKILAVAGVDSLGNSSFEFGLVRYLPDGSLDPGFGDGGIVRTDLTGESGADSATAVATQPDGKIVVAGDALSFGRRSFTQDVGVARYLSSGALDSSFGRGGIVVTSLPAGYAQVADAIVQPDGRIAILGTQSVCDADFNCIRSFAIMRLTASGTPDKTFGQRGVTVSTFGLDSFAKELALQTDGKLIAVGGADGAFAIARYTNNGTLDAGFGQGGLITTPFAQGNALATGVALQPDGKIVAAGFAGANGFPSGVMETVRYNVDGTLDPGFGLGGIATIEIGSGADASDVALQSDGMIVVGGTAVGRSFAPAFALARLKPDGSLDRAFGGGGTLTTSFEHDAELRSLVIQSDGKIVAGGCQHCAADFFSDFALARYLAA
jgi:uncharacterized delta-60 repeat protein